ncbi:hypothetical protein ASC95_17970 [Pelomonas sp. Root1217]|nr:hypothetical protein ASC95_17970 [Pelomonas sp. Root1217]
MDLSLEQLANVEVTLVTGRPATLQSAAASLYVITGEDIRRSTAASLPEALRLAPNLEVSRLNATQYAISARGFNNAIGNKLLVMVDGRTVYSPLFAGVFWDEQLVPLEDVERIEVVSGPGGTLWGANAVNGVINVVTRSSSQTQGLAAKVAGGSKDMNQAFIRWGGRTGETATYRLYATTQRDDNTQRQDGMARPDATSRRQAGFRFDWDDNAVRATVQADAYQGGHSGVSNLAPVLAGGNLLGRWQQRHADGSNWQLQAYFDRASRKDAVLFYEATRTVDVQLSAGSAVGSDHQVLWGAGYRQAYSDTRNNPLVVFAPADRSLAWTNLFVQDEWRAATALRVTAGIKAERNVYTGWEWLPTLRAAYDISSEQVLWASLSRAVRAPSRLDRDFYFPGKPPFSIKGGPAFDSEIGTIAEVGYRGQTTFGNLAVTVFSGEYRKLRGGTPGSSFIENRIDGHVSGAEAWHTVQLTQNWRVALGWSSLRKSFTAQPGTAPNSPTDLGNDPHSQWSIRSNADLPGGFQLDLQLRRVARLPQPAVPAYTASDLRVARQFDTDWTASLLVRNAFDPAHVEFNAPASASEIRRTAYLTLEYRGR